MKKILIGTGIFVLWMLCVVGLGFALHFAGGQLAIFSLVLGLLGAGMILFGFWYHARLGGSGVGETSGPDLVNLGAILRDADRRLAQSTSGVKSIASAPVIYLIGDENSAKTQTVLQSGLDAELIAGNIYRDGAVAPTELINVWLAGTSVIIEAGGGLLSKPGLWLRVVRATQPGRIGSVFSKDVRQPSRAVVVCTSIEHLPEPRKSDPNQIRALGQRVNERLRELSQTLGISCPVYVLFTKLDTLPHFGEYAARLTAEEVKTPLGSLLAPIDAGSGLFAERAANLVSGRFDQLICNLAEFRLNVLSRSGDLRALASAYEFPRDLQKRRQTLVDFLVEVTRPSQLGINPFLRGYFFSGLRAITEDVVQSVPNPQQQRPASTDAGATGFFSLVGGQAPQMPIQSSSRTRRVPQWVFLPHLFAKVLLADDSALEGSRVSARVYFLKRALLVAATACIFFYVVLLTISFSNNRSLEHQLAVAEALPVGAPSRGAYASLQDLQSLDQLGAVLLTLDDYRTGGAPWMDRWGLYTGDTLYPIACQAYAARFRSILLNQTQANILAQLRGTQSPPSPLADYNAAYVPLKAYLITTSNPEKSTRDFLAPALAAAWTGGNQVPFEVSTLAQKQFETYATLLPRPASCLARAGGLPDEPVVQHARAYLNGFGGFQHVYQSIVAVGDAKYSSIRYNTTFPGSAHFIVDDYEVPGAFSKDAFQFMEDAIHHPDKYFNGEEWVVPQVPGATLDPIALPGQLQKQFVTDYLTHWRNYLSKAHFTGYQSMADAAAKLDTLDSNASPILELFSLISINTAVPLPEIANAFQAPQAVVPANSPPNRFVAAVNQPYLEALQHLRGAIQTVGQNPLNANDPTPILQAADAAEQAAGSIRGGFTPDTVGLMDKTSYDRLEDPILAIRGLAKRIPAGGANKAGADFCSTAGPILAKFPFNPQASAEATPDEAARIFSPGQGALARLYSAIGSSVVLQGSQYGTAPASGMPVNPAFLNFFNAAEKVQSALFPFGGDQPTLNFSLSEAKTPGVPDALLNIDGQQVAAGQTNSIRWVSQSGSRITLATDQSSPHTYTGAWSVFRFGFNATHPAITKLEFKYSFQGQTDQIVRFDSEGPGAPLLDPHFMARLHCVSTVIR